MEKKHTSCRIAVNDELDVPTHSERSSSSRDRRYECARFVASETLRVNFKAGELRQRVGKLTIIRLKTVEGQKILTFNFVASCVQSIGL